MEVLENTENDLQIDHRIIDCCVIALTHKVQNLRTCYTTKPVNTGMFMNFPWGRDALKRRRIETTIHNRPLKSSVGYRVTAISSYTT